VLGRGSETDLAVGAALPHPGVAAHLVGNLAFDDLPHPPAERAVACLCEVAETEECGEPCLLHDVGRADSAAQRRRQPRLRLGAERGQMTIEELPRRGLVARVDAADELFVVGLRCVRFGSVPHLRSLSLADSRV
jgi:hypothetical protein